MHVRGTSRKNNTTDIVPDYYVNESDEWLVFPHEIAGLSEEEIREVVKTAAEYEMFVAAHAHGVEGMQRAIRAGVRSIEHDTLMDKETARLMVKHGTYYVPTISAGEFVLEKAKKPGYFPEIIRPKALAIGPMIKETVGMAYRMDVKIALARTPVCRPMGIMRMNFALWLKQG